MFPSLEMVMLVGRRPMFYLVNVMLWEFFFVPIAMLQFSCVREQADARLSVSLAVVLTSVAHKYSISTFLPAISYLTYLDKYVFWSTLLILMITFQGGLIGSIETFYCRTQAVYTDPSPNPVVRRLNAIVRRLAVSGAGGANAGGAVNTGASALGHKVPIYYRDDDCPFSQHSDFNKFDWIDAGCLVFDIFLWLCLQAWALTYYFAVHGAFRSRVVDMQSRRLAFRQFVKRKKARIDEASVSARKRNSGSIRPEAQSVPPESQLTKGPERSSSPTALLRSKAKVLRFVSFQKKSKDPSGLKNYSHLPQSERKAADDGALDEWGRSTGGVTRQGQAFFGPSPQRVLANVPAPAMLTNGSAPAVLANAAESADAAGERAEHPVRCAPLIPRCAPLVPPIEKTPQAEASGES